MVNGADDVEAKVEIRTSGAQAGEGTHDLHLVLPWLDSSQRDEADWLVREIARIRDALEPAAFLGKWHGANLR